MTAHTNTAVTLLLYQATTNSVFPRQASVEASTATSRQDVLTCLWKRCSEKGTADILDEHVRQAHLADLPPCSGAPRGDSFTRGWRGCDDSETLSLQGLRKHIDVAHIDGALQGTATNKEQRHAEAHLWGRRMRNEDPKEKFSSTSQRCPSESRRKRHVVPILQEPPADRHGAAQGAYGPLLGRLHERLRVPGRGYREIAKEGHCTRLGVIVNGGSTQERKTTGCEATGRWQSRVDEKESLDGAL